jgi:RimJ/RimL family protein N-acetyltransferase
MFVRSSRADFKSFKAVHFAIDYKNKSNSDSFLIGCISLIGINPERKKASIGATWIGEEYWKRGIATECVQLLLNYAFLKLGLKEINAYVFPENKASIRMLEKNGMKRVRQFNKYYHVERRYRQLVEFLIYSKNCHYVYLRYPKRIILGLVRQLLTGFRMHVFSIRH